MKRIGIDVGGTNTDAVLIEGDRVRHAVKTATTADVLGGIRTALARLLDGVPAEMRQAGQIGAVMIGTTHFTNAVVQRRHLQKVAALRIGLPASASLPPFVDWPEDLAREVSGMVCMVRGGHEYDGRELVPLDRPAVRDVARRIADAGLRAVAVTGVFSPLDAQCEEEAAAILREEIPDARITLSHQLGRIGLLERENVTLLNACLGELAETTSAAFEAAIAESGLQAPLYLTQNDGTIMHADIARRFPVYCFASGPTNSMRGAAFLSGIPECAVVDVGGTTSDIGFLKGGFPREANSAVEIGGVRTLFRMPDLLSLALGGGTLIGPEGAWIGPRSLGYRLLQDSLCCGGASLTATDIAVAAGRVALGDPDRVRHLDAAMIDTLMRRIGGMIAEGIDRMKVESGDVALLAVGGGSFLIPDRLEGVSEVVRVEHHEVANAVGAAIAQVGGEVDQIYSRMGRDAALEQAQAEAARRAIAFGAALDSLRLVELEEIPLSYLPGDARRVRVRMIGDVATMQPSIMEKQ